MLLPMVNIIHSCLTPNTVERVVMLDVEFESATDLTFQQLLLFLAYCPVRSRFWVDAGVLKYSEGKILS